MSRSARFRTIPPSAIAGGRPSPSCRHRIAPPEGTERKEGSGKRSPNLARHRTPPDCREAGETLTERQLAECDRPDERAQQHKLFEIDVVRERALRAAANHCERDEPAVTRMICA